MNPIIFILLLFAAFGLLDKILDNKFGVCEAFDRGIATMGSFMLSVGGFYCIAVAYLNGHAELFKNSSVLISSILAPDLGGYAIVNVMTESQSMLVFCGVLLSSTLGCLISFQLPIFLNGLDKDEIHFYLKGTMYGIATLVPVLFVAGCMLKVDHFFISFLPVLIVCGILIGLFFVSFDLLIRILTAFSKCVNILGYIFFFLVCMTFFFGMKYTNDTLINEAFHIIFQMTIIVCGSLVLCELVIRKFSKKLEQIGNQFGLDIYSVMGLLLSLGTSIAMLPLFSKMNRKGKICNAAFSLSGAFVFGGQLGFIASMNPRSVTWFVVVKLIAGILAFILAYKMENE